LAGKTSKASWLKTVQSATGENGQEKSCQIPKETKERREKKGRLEVLCTTKWFSAAQRLIESEINCVFLCSLLAATQ